MIPYSNDLRRKIVEVYENNDYSQLAVAKLCGLSLSTVKSIIRRQRETGSSDALPHAGGKSPSLNEKACAFVRQLVEHNNDSTLEEACTQVGRRHKKKASLSTLCRGLQRLGLPRKKRRSTPRKELPQEGSRPEARTPRESANWI
jgi:putative transposase